MSTTVCDGHVESGAACDSKCDPHRAEMRRHIDRQDALFALAHRLGQSGAITEEEQSMLYQVGEAEWDDAIHIASPLDGHISLCGSRGRNLVPLDGPRPGGMEGCWGCLQRADRLDAASVSPASVTAGSGEE